MTDLRKDPIFNVVHEGIKKGIRATLDSRCLRSALILIYSGMDTMAYLDMPASQFEVQRKDFIKWAEGYIHFSCRECVTGEEFYGARCGMVHTYGIESDLSRRGVRKIGYMTEASPEVLTSSSHKDMVMVSIPALAQAFLNAIDRFLVDVFADPSRAKLGEQRLRGMVHEFSLETL